MKRLLVLLLCVGVALPALAVQKPGQLPRTANTFALLNDYVGGDTTSPQVNQQYLMPKMMRGEPIRVALNMGDFSYLPEEEVRYLIAQSYEKWFRQTAEHIRKAKRAAEFEDVLPVLDKGVRVEFVKMNPDIAFSFIPLAQIRQGKPKDRETLAYYTTYQVPLPTIALPLDWAVQKGGTKNPKKLAKFYAAVLLHEIGHSIGLADTYAQGRLASDQLYSTVKIYPSVMDSMHDNYKETHLSCDDATGIVNLMDITRNYTQRGGEKGWHSLCPKAKEYFVHNVSGLKKSYKVEYNDDHVWISGLQKGHLFSRKYPFAKDTYHPLEGIVVNGDVFDSLKRMIHGHTARGEEVFINYLYESRTLAVLRQGKVVYYRQDEYPFSNKSKSKWIVQPGGVLQMWILEKDSKGRQLRIHSWQQDEKGKATSYTKVERMYDKKGHFLGEKRSEQTSQPKPSKPPVAQRSAKQPSASGAQASLEQHLQEKTQSVRLDQFVKDFKIDTKSKGTKLVF